MKRKNVKIWTVVIISMQILLLCIVVTNANAWKNGTTPSGHLTEATINTWRTGRHYGTHDGIAEAALTAVKVDTYAQPWKVNVEQQQVDFWDPRRINIFLIGTEVPDMARSALSITLNGITVHGQKTSRRHNIWFNRYNPVSPGTSMKINIAQCLNLLNSYASKAEVALKDEDCDLAAFYMGVCSHFIADLSNWAHTISWGNLREVWDPAYDYNHLAWMPNYLNNDVIFPNMVARLHSSFESNILTYTRVQWPEGLFSYPRNFRVSPNGIKNPREIAILLAFNTRFDRDITSANQINGATIGLTEGPDNALWMFHHSYTVNEMSNDAVYKNVKKQNGNDGMRYLERVDELLDDGVKAVAQLLDYFGQVWNTTDRQCKECGGLEKAPGQTMSISRALMVAIGLFVFMGVATAFASTIMITQLLSAMKQEKSEVKVITVPIPVR